MIRTTVSIILLLSFSSAATYSDDYREYFSSFITSDNFSKLKEKKELMHSFYSKASVNLITDRELKKIINRDISRIKPNMGIEIVKLLSFSDKMNFSTDKSFLMFYNLLHSLHTLKGITYYSATRKKRRVLFYDSYVIDDPVSQKRVPDPEFTTIPPDNQIYIFQNDSTLGRNIYSVKYISDKHKIIMRTENTTTMKYIFLPLIKPHLLINYFVIVPGEKSIIFYGISFAQFNKNIPMIGNHIDSFYNRLKAMYSWFVDRLKKINY